MGGGFGPHLARPPRTTRREPGFGPDALPKSPRRRRRGSAAAHHVPPRPEATAAAAHGVPPRSRAGWRAARGRRQLTAGTAPQQPQPPPKEPEPERAGPEELLTRATAAAEARLPPTPLHLQRSRRLLERGGEEWESPPTLGLFWLLLLFQETLLSQSLSFSVSPSLKSLSYRRGAGKKGEAETLRQPQGATD